MDMNSTVSGGAHTYYTNHTSQTAHTTKTAAASVTQPKGLLKATRMVKKMVKGLAPDLQVHKLVDVSTSSLPAYHLPSSK
jgi:hypothetical protein